MPPRYAYWTILIGDEPTAFRAGAMEDIMPTFNRLKEKQPTAVLKWFQNGRLWTSRIEAREAMASRGDKGKRNDPRRQPGATEGRWTGKPAIGDGGAKPDWKPKGGGRPEWKPKGDTKPEWKPKGGAKPEWKSKQSTSSTGGRPAWKPQAKSVASGARPEWKPKGEAVFRPQRPDWKPRPQGGKPAWKPKDQGFSRGSRPEWKPNSASRPEWTPKSSARPADAPTGRPESRDKKWRPGGDHKDPRQKYKDAKKAKWTRFKQAIRARTGHKKKREEE
jgi:23S rRNA pseudouridine2605 synthase